MNVEPDKKKARSAKDASINMLVGGIHFTPELIARVATFSEAVVRPGHVGASDVKNMCLAVGPMPSRIIKHFYLENNMGYLEKVNQTFTHRSSAEWARECHLAWMSINTGWRSLVTDELIERNKNARKLISDQLREMKLGIYNYARSSSGDFLVNIHPLLAMVNPTVAIEMNLLEALKYLVEVKGIDINAMRWIGLRQSTGTEYLHLTTTAIRRDEYESFQYLMSVDTIDIYSMKRNYPATSRRKLSIFSYAIDSYIEDENKKRYFDAFVKHVTFRANARFHADMGGVKVTCLHFLLRVLLRRNRMVGTHRVLDAVKHLLDTGANPELEFHDLASPLAVAIGYFTAHDDGDWLIKDALSEIVRMMQEKSDSR